MNVLNLIVHRKGSPGVFEIAEALMYREREALNPKRFMHSSFIESQNPESLTLIS